MGRILLTLLLVSCLALGCSQVKQLTKEMAQANSERVKVEKELAKSFKESYCSWDGAKLRALIGEDIKKMPLEIKEAMDKLDEKCKSEEELASWWGLYQRFYVEIILAAIKKYLPDIFTQAAKLLPL